MSQVENTDEIRAELNILRVAVGAFVSTVPYGELRGDERDLLSDIRMQLMMYGLRAKLLEPRIYGEETEIGWPVTKSSLSYGELTELIHDHVGEEAYNPEEKPQHYESRGDGYHHMTPLAEN